MEFKKANNYTGWLVFLIATVVYFITLEPTVSLWDCGEYITAAYKLEVGHPPGAPLFMMLGRLFSFFADPTEVAMWINRLSALASSFTVLFMFWTISMFAKKIALTNKRTLQGGESIAILGSAAVGALAYTFSDSFWFSAVEGEVYSMASFFTAIVFWALMKFDHELSEKKHGEIDSTVFTERWLIFIFFMLGLAIGVHLLGLLIIPSIAYVLYFNSSRKINFSSFVVVGIIGVVALAFVQDFLIPGTISLASSCEIFFKNSLGLPFFSGSIFFFVLLIGGTALLIRWSRINRKFYLHIAGLCFAFLLIGYGSFATIVIRSNANTPLDENDPENLVTLHSYLKREQYGSAPILYGPYWNSQQNENREDWKDRSPVFLRRFVVTKNEADIKAFKDETRATKFAKETGGGAEVNEKYYLSNEDSYKNATPTYAQNTIFPRMFYSDEPVKVNAYKTWSGYDDKDGADVEVGSDDKRLPTFGENINFFMRYQVDWMYFRYFMWNFAGRQNDIQGHGDAMRGNWATGFASLDAMRLGAQGKDAPQYTNENPANNKFFLLPLILGLIGMIYHFFKAPKDAFIIFLTFIFTGLAIVIYLNQKPFEPRERDYAYAASFYAFAMWIGMSVYALYAGVKSLDEKISKQSLLTIVGGGVAIFIAFGGMMTGSMASSLMLWGYIVSIGALLIGLFVLLRKSLSDKGLATAATIITLAVPTLMMVQGWDDHSREDKTSAHDLAYNYMMSCNENGIIFTNGDNDTFPLWYLQEVEGVRKDLRVANLSLMSSDWYTEQMKLKTYSSDPLPIKFTEDQICSYSGGTDQIFMLSYLDMYSQGWAQQEEMKKMLKRKLEVNAPAFDLWKVSAKGLLGAISQSMTAAKPEVDLNPIREAVALISKDSVSNDNVTLLDNIAKATIMLAQGQGQQAIIIEPGLGQQLQQFMTNFDNTWDYLPAVEALDYVRNDKNMVVNNGNSFRISPSCGFIIPVNIENAIASKIIKKEQATICHKELRMRIDESYLLKSDIMSLDIIANNNWKRSIYFSSAGSNSISKAFYKSGYIKQNGMAAELSPLLDRNPVETDKMYTNMMSTYHYGKMNQKGVLTDYYTRRHTSQFRQLFEQLAGTFTQEVAQIDQFTTQFNTAQMGLMRQAGQFKQIDSIQKIINEGPAKKAEMNKKIIALINKSISVMPVDLVFDYGEPMQQNTEKGPRMRDGILQNYVQLLYTAGDKKGANKLGNDVARQLESTLNYFQKSSPSIVAENAEDMMAAVHAYFVLYYASNNPKTGEPQSTLGIRTKNRVDRFLGTDFKAIIAMLNAAAMDDESTVKQDAMVMLKGEVEEIMQEFGFSSPTQNKRMPGTNPAQIPSQQ